jgi:hypothetical protein
MYRPFTLKTVDEAARTFEGRAAAFSLDLGGDVILPGAFKRTIKDWKGSKKVLPLLDSHNGGTVRAVVGKLLEADEVAPVGADPGGLDARFEMIDGPDGDEVYRRVKGGYVDGLSIGYRAVEVKYPSPEEEQEGIFRFLKQVQLKEVSVVLWPMNTDARIDMTTVKALLASARDRELDRDELEELKSVDVQIRALLAKHGGTLPSPGGPPPAPAGLALEDPRRLALEARARELTLRSLGTSAL